MESWIPSKFGLQHVSGRRQEALERYSEPRGRWDQQKEIPPGFKSTSSVWTATANVQCIQIADSIPFHTIPIITQAPPSNALFVVPQRFEVARFPSWDAVGIFQGPSQVPGSQAVPGLQRSSTLSCLPRSTCGFPTSVAWWPAANAMQMPCKCHAELQRIVWFSRDNSSLCPVSMKTSQKTNRAQKSSCQNARPYDAA